MTEAHDHDRYLARMRNRQRAQALPLKQICAPNLRVASVHHSSRRSLCFAFLFSLLENQAARECGCQGTSRVATRTRRGPKTRPWNDTQAKAHGTKPSVEPQDEMFKNVQNWRRMWHFFRTSAAKPASPSLQLNITPGRFLKEIPTLSSPPKEHHIRGPF